MTWSLSNRIYLSLCQTLCQKQTAGLFFFSPQLYLFANHLRICCHKSAAAKGLQSFDFCSLLLDEEGIVVALFGDGVVLRFAMIFSFSCQMQLHPSIFQTSSQSLPKLW